MSSKMELNLINTISWVGLLRFKNALIKMVPGETLDILTECQETVDHLARLVGRSNDQVIMTRKEKDYFRIRVQKG